MSDFKHLIFELEDYARQNGGRFWLLDVPSRNSPPPRQLWIVVDFDEGQTQASVFVDIVCRKHRFPVLVFQAAEMAEEFKRDFLPNALVLWGPPYNNQMNYLGSAAHFRKRFPALVSADQEIEIRHGWVGILERFLEQVPENVGFELRGTRQKFGMLEIEWRTTLPLDDEAEHRILAAAALAGMRSKRTCEFCGQPGRQRMEDGGRIFTACDLHGMGVEPIDDGGNNVTVLRGLRFEYDPETDSVSERPIDEH